MAEDIGSDDCIKDDDCLFACFTKHDQHDSIQNIKRSMESNYMYTDFNFHTVHTEVVKSHLLKLKCNKATGYDLLPAKLLRMGSDSKMVENIKKSVEAGKVVCVVLMDLSRAFDCIPYKLFLSKLRAYGFSHSACELFLSYYRNRKQRVKLGNCRSEWQYVYKGSAQGSLMGPQSYNMFTNDMLFILDDDVDIYNYADDNTFVCSVMIMIL